MSNFTQSMVENLSKKQIEIAPETLCKLWDISLKSNWKDSLENLASIENMPAILEEKVKNCNLPEVQIKYMLRKNFKNIELKLRLKKEKRNQVLAGVLKDIDEDKISAVDSIFLEHYLSKSTALLAEAALSRSAHLSDNFNVAITELLGGRYHKLSDTAKSDCVRMYDRLLTSSRGKDIVLYLPDPYVERKYKYLFELMPDNENMHGKVVQSLIVNYMDNGKNSGYNLTNNIENIISLGSPALNNLVYKLIVNHEVEDTHKDRLESLKKVLNQDSADERAHELDKVKNANLDDLRNLIEKSSRSETLNKEDVIMAEAVKNPNLLSLLVTDRKILYTFSRVSEYLIPDIIKNAINPLYVKILYLNEPHKMVEIDKWEFFQGIDEGVKFYSRFLGESLESDEKVLAEMSTSYSTNFGIIAVFKEERHLRMLPFSKIQGMVNHYSYRDESIQRLLVNVFEELSNDLNQWSAFDALSDNFSGTLEELIQASQHI